MNHKVNSVQQLFDDAKSMYTELVTGGGNSASGALCSADAIIKNLADGVRVLKNSWEGKDAGIQINSVIEVHNAMVKLRNALGSLSSDSSKVAANYRTIQNTNGANLEPFGPIESDEIPFMEPYEDNRDTININPEANEGKTRIDSANDSIEEFISKVSQKYNSISDNWTVGTGRDKAQSAFDEFIGNSKKHRETLANVSLNITNALKNYNF